MQVVVLALVSLLMWNQGAVDSVRIVDLRVAAHMAEGSDALLGCSFDLAGEVLYSLKWYKDGKEFFRYVPKAFPVMKSFYAPGVSVDLNRSSENFIALKRLTRESTGVYQCEVKAESPTFTMVSQEKHVMIDLLPTTGPIIYGLQKEYYIGSQVDLNCTTTPSRPEAQLKWLINGAPAPGSYLQGPYLLIPTNRPFTYQSKLALKFTVNAYHFDQEGAMTLKCQAAIPPLYDQETQYTYYEPLSRTTLSPTTEINKDNAAMMDIPIVLLIIQTIFLLLFNSN